MCDSDKVQPRLSSAWACRPLLTPLHIEAVPVGWFLQNIDFESCKIFNSSVFVIRSPSWLKTRKCGCGVNKLIKCLLQSQIHDAKAPQFFVLKSSLFLTYLLWGQLSPSPNVFLFSQSHIPSPVKSPLNKEQWWHSTADQQTLLVR